MCGICGVLGTRDSFAAGEEVVSRMRETLVHRGPDDGGTWTAPRIGLGHRRLSIIDLSPAGHQPMSNEDGTVWVTFGGEIYNHEELRPELEAKGHVYRSHTDTETIVHLYEEEGPRCVERLDGMFHYAIWDTRSRELHLARDRLGKKPLYYAQPDGGFLFASEIKALLEHPSLTPELDEEAFFHHLTFACAPAPLTMFAGVRKLSPAQRMTVRADGSREVETYWSPFGRTVEGSDPELAEELLGLLRSAVEKRMMSDVPFGVFLSGGIDSSTNVALMSEQMSRPVETFTVGFSDAEYLNELEEARRIAKQFGTNHHEVIISEKEMHEFLPRMVFHQDEPIADPVCVPLYYVSKLARDSGTIVVQVGEGSDEIFSGYENYVRHLRIYENFWRYAERTPPFLRRAASSMILPALQATGRKRAAVELMR